MSTIPTQKPDFFNISTHATRNHHKNQTFPASLTMDSKSSLTRNTEEQQLSLEHHHVSSPKLRPVRPLNLGFDRSQPNDEELGEMEKWEFGQFVAREAVLDEEFWTAAWLRAESHWENKPGDRYAESNKIKFAEQEFNALKRRQKSPLENSTCIVVVRKDVKCNIIKSIVGTLDLSIRYLLPGETFPGEKVKASAFRIFNKSGESRYSYIANLVVTPSARRRGVASNMLLFAIRLAKSNGVEEVFVHVHRDNKSAQELYQKIGFQVIEIATGHLTEEGTYLYCLK